MAPPGGGGPPGGRMPPEDGDGPQALDRTVTIKLNGGLGTSMGMTKAKSLLEVKDGLTFIDIIVRQATELGVPLVLMNSFATRDDTMGFIGERHPDADVEDFLQNKEPKIGVDDLMPVEWPDDPDLEWCPPGHGDLY